jgi:hypothetical protein
VGVVRGIRGRGERRGGIGRREKKMLVMEEDGGKGEEE